MVFFQKSISFAAVVQSHETLASIRQDNKLANDGGNFGSSLHFVSYKVICKHEHATTKRQQSNVYKN
jgi:hypothetical protein